MGFKYTKSDLEMIVYRQLSYLEVLGEKVKLLEKQNGLLLKYNNKLMEELGETKVIIPYPKLVRKRINNPPKTLVAETHAKTKKGR